MAPRLRLGVGSNGILAVDADRVGPGGAAGERAEPVEMRLDVTKQRIGQMQPKQVGQRGIGAIEIHPRRIRREQSGPIGRGVAILLEGFHFRLLFVLSGATGAIDHLPIKQAIKPSTGIIGGPPHGRRLSHHRRRDVALFGQGPLLFSLQGAPASMDLAQRGEPGGIREIRENADHPAGGDAGGYWHPGFHADHRSDRKTSPRTVDPSRRPGRAIRLRADRRVRRRVGQQMDVSLPLGPRRRPDQLVRPHRADARAEGQRAGACRVGRTGAGPHGGPGLVRRLE